MKFNIVDVIKCKLMMFQIELLWMFYISYTYKNHIDKDEYIIKIKNSFSERLLKFYDAIEKYEMNV